MVRDSNKSREFLSTVKRLFPAAGIALLTIILLFYFKYNKSGNLLEEGVGNIEDFYTQNLKPLFFNSEITNEEIFNFALYGNLPVDRNNNKIIQIKEPS